MSFLSAFRLPQAVADFSEPADRGLLTPWNPSNHLETVVLSDIFGVSEFLPITRGDAMRVPSVAKARALITGTASGLPLQALAGGVPVRDQPTFLYRTNSQVSPQQRMLWTIDDLIFCGWSLWAVERGSGRQIVDAVRVPSEWWRFSQDRRVEVLRDGEWQGVANDSVILFSGPQEGLLEIGARAIRSYQDLEATRASRLRNPIASVVLHATEELNLEDDEISALVNKYADSHRSSSMSVSYLPHNLGVEEHGTASPELFLQAENAINVQVAQFTNVPATLLDASIEGSSSLTYQNNDNQRSWFVDTTLAYWLGPIEARLSLDDVVPRGTYVQFDRSHLTTLPPTAPALED